MRAGRTAVLVLATVVLQTLPGHAAMMLVRTIPVKRGPAAIAFDPVSQLAYVASITDDSVAVLAGAAQVAEITQPGLNPAGVAVDPVGMRLLVTSFSANRVNVYATTDRHKTASVTVPSPWGIAVDSGSGNAFVAGFSTNTLEVIDKTNAVHSVPLSGCAGAIGVAYSDQTKRVVVTCVYSGTVHIVDAISLLPIATVTVGLGAYSWGVAADPSSSLAYVANWAGGAPTAGTITVIDVALGAAIATAFTGGAPMGVAVSTLGSPYATLNATHKLAALEPKTGALLETIDLPRDASTPGAENNPQAVAVHPSGRYAIVGNFNAESVSLIETGTYL